MDHDCRQESQVENRVGQDEDCQNLGTLATLFPVEASSAYVDERDDQVDGAHDATCYAID